MKIFTKRNALVGYMVLKSGSRARRRALRRTRKWSSWKLATLLVLGVVSVGILAAFALVVLRRQRDGQGLLEGDTRAEDEAESHDLAASTEPISAT